MPDVDLDDGSDVLKETFPFEIKINSGEKSTIFSMLKNIGIKNVLEED